ncbi:hypothetical protein AK830_g1766 [Neonectria ditissima]|uniref:Ubiquitin-like domain-containing protein n=1 Tax=Neonectria ditissima TaxID=78410 RepID=A0A0P7BYB1_9HYPO|nr:hypothetical protein AK830_g1766 [Neonectria ditissima]
MDPVERDVGGAGAGGEAAGVHLSLEPLRLVDADRDVQPEDTGENEDEDIARLDPETVVWPHSPDPQAETPPPMPQEHEQEHGQHTDEESDAQPRDKGKQPERLNYTTAFPESDAGSSQTVPPTTAPGILPPVSTAGLAHGQPIPWELDPERPAQKLPIRFRDILGRSILIPWQRAKTWEGMKMTIDAHFLGPEGEHMDSMLTYSVANVRYSLMVSLPSSVEPPKRRSSSRGRGIHASNDNDNGNGSSSSNDDHNNSNNASNRDIPQPEPSSPPMRPMVILPEFWDDLIQPGSNVVMNLWPRAPRAMYDLQPPNNVPGIQPLGPGMGMNQGHMPPMAPPPPQPHFIRIVGVQKTRPKTKASTGRPRRR